MLSTLDKLIAYFDLMMAFLTYFEHSHGFITTFILIINTDIGIKFFLNF